MCLAKNFVYSAKKRHDFGGLAYGVSNVTFCKTISQSHACVRHRTAHMFINDAGRTKAPSARHSESRVLMGGSACRGPNWRRIAKGSEGTDTQSYGC